MKKAVIYARYSSDKQTEQSIEGQLRVCEEFAKRNDYIILNKYIDRAMTGTNDHRPAFQQMIKDSIMQAFDFVIVYKLDRFARNRYDSALNKQKLKKNGVRVLSAMEQITDSPEGIILESVIEGMNEYYSKELSQKVKRGQYETIQKKNFVGGFIPIGYQVKDKKLIPNKEEIPIVNYIFHNYISGMSIKDIISNLHSQGYTNSRGKKFINDNIIKILKNPVYVGTLRHGEHYIDDYYPAIIDKETFEFAQKRIEMNKHRPATFKSKTTYLLSGKLYCGLCKQLMVGESGNSRTTETYHYYKCSNRKKTGNCQQNSLRKTEFEDFIINTTLQHLYEDNFYETIIQVALEQQKENLNNHNVIKSIEQKLKDCKKQLNNLLEAIKAGVFTPSTREALLTLEQDIKMYEDKLIIEKSQMPLELTEQMLEYWFEQFKDYDKTDSQLNKTLIDTFIHKIIVYLDKIVIIYNHSDHNKEEFSLDDYEDLTKKNPNLEKCSDFNGLGGAKPLKSETISLWRILGNFSILEITILGIPNWLVKKQA